MLNLNQIAGMGLIYKMYSLDYMLEDLAKIGFKAFELWGAYPHQFVDGKDSFPPCSVVRRKIESYDMKLVCYTPEQLLYYYNIASDDADIRKKSVTYYKRAIEAASELGADKMLMTSGWGLYDQKIEDAWSYSCESLRTLAEYAQTMGIVLVLENLNPFESNLVHSLPTMKKMLEDINHPAFKAMVDTVPMHYAGETMQEYLDAFGDDLIHVHLIDGKPIGHLAWGKGYLPLDQDVQSLVDYGYKHAITFEIAGGEQEHPGMEMRQSFERVQKYLG